jgi:hypothetical protein
MTKCVFAEHFLSWTIFYYMKTITRLALLIILTTSAHATEHYVNLNNPTPAPPYADWSSAATTIQDAIDAADSGDLILVTNGVYQTGARAVYGMSNRVAVIKPVTVRSVNGPAVTQIKGHWGSPYGNGPTAVRCVYLTNGAVLAGFTLTNGTTQYYGDTYTNESGGGVWCEDASAVVSNCVLTGNSAWQNGGGAYSGTLASCTLMGNSAPAGGGASGGILNNSSLMENSASVGGGAYYSMLNNCILIGNSTDSTGGGVYGGTLNNCTLTGNSADSTGGGAAQAMLNNCIVYYNNAPYGGANFNGSTFNYCCTTPMPAGTGNLVEEPQLADATHLGAGSRCIGRGSATYVSGVDIDGEPWANPPSIGCDEYWSGSITGAMSVAIAAAYTNVAVGFEVDLQAVIGGRVSASRWDFGDGNVVSNRPWVSHAWSAAGDYAVELRAYNESYPAGVAATVTVHVAQEEHYVALSSTNPVSPYSSWGTAATDIQHAVDVATLPGALVLVSNGVYQTGTRAVQGANRVAVTKPVTVRSVNGSVVTQIKGYRVPGTTNDPAAVRCVYLTNGAVLAGFTLTNGAASSGGGVWCEGLSAVLSNCVLTGNSANYGGGSFSGTLNNCVLTGNLAKYDGGAEDGTLNNCTLTRNSASLWSGAYFGTLNNCILYYNGNTNYMDCTLSYCCTTPLPDDGTGNLTNTPLFLDTNGWSNLRLQTNSPCINAGNNAYTAGSADLHGDLRIVGGTVDMGAYEFQSPASALSYAWLQQFGLPTDGSADDADTDLDGLNNWQEWQAGTNPTNAASVLQMLSVTTTNNPAGNRVTWQSVGGIVYYLQRSTNLAAQPAFVTIGNNIGGQVGTTSYTDTSATNTSPFFYRVGVQK